MSYNMHISFNIVFYFSPLCSIHVTLFFTPHRTSVEMDMFMLKCRGTFQDEFFIWRSDEAGAMQQLKDDDRMI